MNYIILTPRNNLIGRVVFKDTQVIKQQDSGQGILLLIPGQLEEVMRPDMAEKSKPAVRALSGDDHADSSSWNERKA